MSTCLYTLLVEYGALYLTLPGVVRNESIILSQHPLRICLPNSKIEQYLTKL